MQQAYIYCTLRGRIKGAASAIIVIQHSLCGGARNTAWHMITVIVLAFLTQENKSSKMQSTINQLKHGKGCAVCDNGTLRTVQHFLPCLIRTDPSSIPIFHALKPVLDVYVS